MHTHDIVVLFLFPISLVFTSCHINVYGSTKYLLVKGDTTLSTQATMNDGIKNKLENMSADNVNICYERYNFP